MPRVLIQFAHPALEGSRVHRRLLAQLPRHEGLTSTTSTRRIPISTSTWHASRRSLVAHDVIVFQHPFFWYSTPPLLKQWEDLVLEHGWAYGRQGRALRGKQLCMSFGRRPGGGVSTSNT